MKIDEMLSREDFLEILRETLNNHYCGQGLKFELTKSRKNEKQVLVIYDKLNAIISTKPSSSVKEYLYTEYSVGGCLLYRLVVKWYIKLLLGTKGMFSYKVRVYVSSENVVDFSNWLIFPCSKKIRIFDFKRRTIEVISKSGFPVDSIKNEIEFRLKHHSSHIIPVVDYGINWYRELIINGKPLARIRNSWSQYLKVKGKSLEVLAKITEPYKKRVNSQEYKLKVINEIKNISSILFAEKKHLNDILYSILDSIEVSLEGFNESIITTLSHGDFHHGNIWIENTSKSIVIIDWETVTIRSEWYDVFTLYGGLREVGGIKDTLSKVFNQNSANLIDYIDNDQLAFKFMLVLLEDLYFRLTDAYRIPKKLRMGQLEAYIVELYSLLISRKFYPNPNRV